MTEYHGIVIDLSFRDPLRVHKLTIIGEKKYSEWTLYKIEIPENKLKETIKFLQDELCDGFYCHLYREDSLFVIFKNSVFKIKPDHNTWKKAIAYGKMQGIPEEQLDFNPCRFQDEDF